MKGWDNIKLDLSNGGVMVWSGFVWIRIWSNSGFVNTVVKILNKQTGFFDLSIV